MSWTLKPLTRDHISAAAALFNQSVADGEMIFSPLDEAVFERRFFQPGAHAFARTLTRLRAEMTDAIILAHDLARRIESELEYPGQIKVHVLRETKVVEYAK